MLKEDFLAAFMMSSILLNPQLIIYSAALGRTALCIRIIVCFLCGVAAGALLHYCFKEKNFFNFKGFAERAGHDTHPNLFLRFLFNLVLFPPALVSCVIGLAFGGYIIFFNLF